MFLGKKIEKIILNIKFIWNFNLNNNFNIFYVEKMKWYLLMIVYNYWCDDRFWYYSCILIDSFFCILVKDI